MLPDVFVWEKESQHIADTASLTDYRLDGNLLRFSTALGNKGTGALEIRGGASGGGEQQLHQRIYNDDGTFEDVLMDGQFTFHEGHDHIHFDGYAEYALRTKTEAGTPGDIVATGGKISFCLLDIEKYDPTAPSSTYDTCDEVRQGISAGWSDVYDSTLPDQYINVASVPDGFYFLEVTVDPDNQIIESDESNNSTAIEVEINRGAAGFGDRFEPSASFDEPHNLGAVIDRIEDGLSIHNADDIDYYLVTAAEPGSFNAEITYTQVLGDINLSIYDSSENLIVSSTETTGIDTANWSVERGESFYLKVEGVGNISNGYSLRLNGPGEQEIVEVFSDDVPIAIPDGNIGGGIEAQSLLLGPDLDVQDVNLIIKRLDHTYLSDLKFRLISPSGTSSTLITSYWTPSQGIIGPSRTTGLVNTIIDDQSNISLSGIDDPRSGTFNVDHPSVGNKPLSVFNGENAAGPWKLSISDFAGGDTGQLFEWGLQFTTPVYGDVHEPNNNIAQAVVLAESESQSDLSIHFDADVDYFRLTPDTNGILNLDLGFDPATGDIAVELINSAKFVVATGVSHDGGAHINQRIDEGELYFLRVNGVDSALNDYSLSIDVRGDVNADGVLDVVDIDALLNAIATQSANSQYDLDFNEIVDFSDVEVLVTDLLQTQLGDANLDGRVDSLDLNQVGLNWQSLDNTWSDGDFNGDGLVSAADLNFVGLHWRFGTAAAAPIVQPLVPIDDNVTRDLAKLDTTQTNRGEAKEPSAVQEVTAKPIRSPLARESVIRRRIYKSPDATKNPVAEKLDQVFAEL